MKTKAEEVRELISIAVMYADMEADSRESIAEDWADGDPDRKRVLEEAAEIREGLRELEKEGPEIARAFRALELLRRGETCGIFDDAPVYRADVREVLK